MIEDVYKKVAEELGLDYTLIKNTYTSYWTSIRKIIEDLPLKDDLSEEEFDSLRCNFNIGGLGKLNVTKKRYEGIKKRYELIKDTKKNAKTEED